MVVLIREGWVWQVGYLARRRTEPREVCSESPELLVVLALSSLQKRDGYMRRGASLYVYIS